MFISNAMAAEPASGASGGYTSLIMMVLFGVVFYFLLIRPQNKRQKEHKSMLASIEKGAEVVTSGGILGKVNKISDNFIVLNVAQGVEMKFQKHAVTATLPEGTIKAINKE